MTQHNLYALPTGRVSTGGNSTPTTRAVWEVPADRRSAFQRLGFNQKRPFFEHRIVYLPKAAPDAKRLASRMCGLGAPGGLWQIGLYAHGPSLEGFPPELFVDHDLVWHQQHLGIPGHIAYGSLAVKGSRAYVLNLVSDVVQRISRRREHKTRIENRFRSWPYLLLNASLHFADRRGIRRLFVPTAEWMMRHTDPARNVGSELFRRVYDSPPIAIGARRTQHWWIVDVRSSRDQIVTPHRIETPVADEKTICVLHDIERTLGHPPTETNLAWEHDENPDWPLARMLEIERRAGVSATYNVVGCLLPDVREGIEHDSHCLAFHSYDHRHGRRQLRRCREIDYRLPGYRPPRSRLTFELRSRNLCRHNFDWLAAGHPAVRGTVPRLANRVVRIPVAFDDYPMFRSGVSYADWQYVAVQTLNQRPFVAFGLHDCYAHLWIDHYDRLIDQLAATGRLRTLDDVAHRAWLAAAW